MEISQQGIDLLTQRESKRNDAYLDSKGIVTIGIGHVDPNVKMGDVWTDEQIEEAFRADLAKFEAAVNAAVRVTIEQYSFDALVSFSHNCGANALAHGNNGGPSAILSRLNAGDFDGAAEGFDHWHNPPEITSRRNGEREQFKGTAFEARIP